jgi:hypothetical protein
VLFGFSVEKNHNNVVKVSMTLARKLYSILWMTVADLGGVFDEGG